MRTIINFIFVLLIFLRVSIFAQTENNKDTLNLKTNSTDTIKFVMKKSPAGAVIRSILLPGLGQFYNKSYWKIPIIWGVMGYLGYNWYIKNNDYKKYRDLYNSSITSSNPSGNLNYRNLREFYRDQRDLTAVFFGLAYVINILDAYVDAHLYDFDVSPSVLQNQFSINMRINF